MSTAVPELVRSAVEDLGLLARQYAQLTNIKVKDSAREVLAGACWTFAGLTLGALAVAELTFAVALWLVMRPELDPARAAAVAALLTGVLGVVLAAVGIRYLKRVDIDPTVSMRPRVHMKEGGL